MAALSPLLDIIYLPLSPHIDVFPQKFCLSSPPQNNGLPDLRLLSLVKITEKFRKNIYLKLPRTLWPLMSARLRGT